MAVDRAWLVQNLGFDPTEPPPSRVAAAALAAPEDDVTYARELIEFDSEASEGAAFAALATTSTGMSRFVDIPWPKGLEPQPGPKPTGDSLPSADVLVVTWTVEEGHALSRVLTPGFDSRDDWKDYTKNFAQLSKDMPPLAPARQARRLGTYWTTRIGTQRVTLFKSDSHMSQDGPALPNADVWRQIIADCQPNLVITTGTGGGIGASEEVGDVIVSRYVTFECQRVFKRFDGQSFSSPGPVPRRRFRGAERLFETNAAFLPKSNPRLPQIFTARGRATGILTTDFFGFDTSDNRFGLQGGGALSEMGDAVLGMVCKQLGASAPKYVAVRNVSDPQIAATGLTFDQQRTAAASIYKVYGRWSTVCSTIVCWALIASN